MRFYSIEKNDWDVLLRVSGNPLRFVGNKGFMQCCRGFARDMNYHKIVQNIVLYREIGSTKGV